MFTGIVKGTFEVSSIDKFSEFHTIGVKLGNDMMHQLTIGASVANNGCCLTVTKIENEIAYFDVIRQSLNITNLGSLKVGDRVNIERAAKFGDEIGGHAMSGHIFCQAQIDSIENREGRYQVWFVLPNNAVKYIMDKGYIGIDGASLTISNVVDDRFSVDLIPETLARTRLGSIGVGDSVNIEIDPQTQTIVNTVERILNNKK